MSTMVSGACVPTRERGNEKNVLSHGNYSLYEPQQMLPENKDYFGKILRDFMANYRFNPELFPTVEEGQV